MSENDALNSFEEITTYNNFYEFRTGNQTLTEIQKNLFQNHGQFQLKVCKTNYFRLRKIKKNLLLKIESTD